MDQSRETLKKWHHMMVTVTFITLGHKLVTSLRPRSQDRTFGGGDLGLIRPQSRETSVTEHPLGLTLSRETSLFILAEVSSTAFFSERALMLTTGPSHPWSSVTYRTQEHRGWAALFGNEISSLKVIPSSRIKLWWERDLTRSRYRTREIAMCDSSGWPPCS